jgi:hypothetical protein
MLNKALGFLGGFSFGFLGIWGCHQDLYNDLNLVFGRNLILNQDYLHVPSSGSLEERRNAFKEILAEKGASFRLVQMIGDSNRELYEAEAAKGMSEYNSEITVIEKYFRIYYPELFDDKPGKDFIISLNLKTKCADFDVPKLLYKPR